MKGRKTMDGQGEMATTNRNSSNALINQHIHISDKQFRYVVTHS